MCYKIVFVQPVCQTTTGRIV